MRRWATAKEVAEYLKLKPHNVYRLVRERAIPGHRLGERTMRFDLDEVDRAIAKPGPKPILTSVPAPCECPHGDEHHSPIGCLIAGCGCKAPVAA